MSVEIMSAVWKLDLPQQLKLLALALADFADDDGANVFPSVARLAWKVGASERTVQRHLRELEALGIVEVVSRGVGRSRTSLMVVHPEKGDDLSPFVEEKVTPDAKKVTPRAQKGDTAMSPNPSVTVNNHQRGRDEIWEALTQMFGPVSNDDARGKRNRACKLLRQSGATPEEMWRRFRRWPDKFAGATLTDKALATHWDALSTSHRAARVVADCTRCLNRRMVGVREDGSETTLDDLEATSTRQCRCVKEAK